MENAAELRAIPPMAAPEFCAGIAKMSGRER